MANPRNLANIAPNINSSSTGSIVLKGASTSADGVGVTFPATQVASTNANTLDDYEQGTFTPVIEGTTTAGTATYNARSGAYTKIGNLVTAFVYVDWSSFNGTGNIKFTGLPFATVNTTNRFFSVCFGSWNDVSLTAGNVPISYVGSNSTAVFLNQSSTGTGTVTGVPVDALGTIIFTFTYNSAD